MRYEIYPPQRKADMTGGDIQILQTSGMIYWIRMKHNDIIRQNAYWFIAPRIWNRVAPLGSSWDPTVSVPWNLQSLGRHPVKRLPCILQRWAVVDASPNSYISNFNDGVVVKSPFIFFCKHIMIIQSLVSTKHLLDNNYCSEPYIIPCSDLKLSPGTKTATPQLNFSPMMTPTQMPLQKSLNGRLANRFEMSPTATDSVPNVQVWRALFSLKLRCHPVPAQGSGKEHFFEKGQFI